LSEWVHYAKQIQTLRGRLGFAGSTIDFLAYSVDLESGSVFDQLRNVHVAKPNVLYILLSHYANARVGVNLGELVRFGDLPGGHAYEGAFVNRAISSITKVFGSDPRMLVEAAKVLNGIEVGYGDLSVEIPALPRIPLTYIIWKGDDEFQASSTLLFDSSESHYLPTEDLAVLGELTTRRLRTFFGGTVMP
jgi:hypothetical protein